METMNQRKEFKPMSMVEKYYGDNDESKERI
jgi:hypothetical protein